MLLKSIAAMAFKFPSAGANPCWAAFRYQATACPSTPTVLIHHAQVGLSRRQALFGRLSIPSDSLPEVFWDTQFILIHDAEIGLRQGEAAFRYW